MGKKRLLPPPPPDDPELEPEPEPEPAPKRAPKPVKPAAKAPPAADPHGDFDVLSVVSRPLFKHGEPFHSIIGFERVVELYGLNLKPEWNRNGWSNPTMSNFVGFLLEGGLPGAPIVISRKLHNPDPVSEVADGLRRIRAVLAWSNGEIPAFLHDGRTVHRRDLSPRSVSYCSQAIGLLFSLCEMTPLEVLEYHWRSNTDTRRLENPGSLKSFIAAERKKLETA